MATTTTERMWLITSIDLDVAYDETLEDTLATIPEDVRVTYKVTNPNGPGGGWPILSFHGVRAELERLIREWYSSEDTMHADYLVGSIGVGAT